jgi:predicted Rossmann fold nucleotide-binding protein DprA/Smf involved in DNA uptake
MELSSETQAALLLTGHFHGSEGKNVRPLGPSEWARFASCLKEQGLRPSSLLEGSAGNLRDLIEQVEIPGERIEALLQRSVALALSLEKWNRAGIWVMSRASREYPQKLKQRLGVQAPPILYGCGDEGLLNSGGLAIVGSRNAGDADLSLTAELSRFAANEGIVLVSGGARGVDDTAMQTVLGQRGVVIGVLADSLQRNAVSSKYRGALREHRAVLVSAAAPEARFNVGNAMARNKYIYCLADAAVVIHSGSGGGTWNGAVEALRHQWVPVWVARSSDQEAANPLLVEKGAAWLPPEALSGTLTGLIGPDGDASPQADIPMEKASAGERDLSAEGFEDLSTGSITQRVAMTLRDGPMSARELNGRLGIPLRQLHHILRKAAAEGLIIKRTRPVRYEAADQGSGRQLKMFES